MKTRSEARHPARPPPGRRAPPTAQLSQRRVLTVRLIRRGIAGTTNRVIGALSSLSGTCE